MANACEILVRINIGLVIGINYNVNFKISNWIIGKISFIGTSLLTILTLSSCGTSVNKYNLHKDSAVTLTVLLCNTFDSYYPVS